MADTIWQRDERAGQLVVSGVRRLARCRPRTWRWACADPVTLDDWMCKYVMLPCRTSQTFMNPDDDNNLRKTRLGCRSKGVGTI
jgi:hypothetical protein